MVLMSSVVRVFTTIKSIYINFSFTDSEQLWIGYQEPMIAGIYMNRDDFRTRQCSKASSLDSIPSFL